MISILGCGWLGMPLAKELAKSYSNIKGSTTKVEKLKEIEENGIFPFLINLSQINQKDIKSFLDNDILIVNVPPGRSLNLSSSYIDNLKNLISHINKSNIKNVVFVSSTSVYKENNGIVTEQSELSDTESAQRMITAEQLFLNNPNFSTTFIRMSGLIGPNRHPGRFFTGKENFPNGLSPVNLIHLDDCIGIILSVIKNNYWGQIINAAALSHPTKTEFYSKATTLYNGTTASFIDEKLEFKIISSEKLVKDLCYDFKHPDLMKWLQE